MHNIEIPHKYKSLSLFHTKAYSLLLLKLPTQQNQILLWESFTDTTSMDLTDFNCNYLNKLIENISKEQKSILLLEILMSLLNSNLNKKI